MQDELIEYNKCVCLCCAGLSFLFLLIFISDLVVRCINDCCHLEVAHTVESLQFFSFQQITKCTQFWNRAAPIRKSSRINADKTAKVSSVTVLGHDAYYAKKSAFLWDYTGYCVSKQGGGRELQSGTRFRAATSADCCTVWHLMSEKSSHLVSPRNMYFVGSASRPVITTQINHYTDHLLLWTHIIKLM